MATSLSRSHSLSPEEVALEFSDVGEEQASAGVLATSQLAWCDDGNTRANDYELHQWKFVY